MEIHRSARRHGITDDAIGHALRRALVVVGLDALAGPPRALVIGPDRAGNLLELIVLELASDRVLVVHAMPLRSDYFELLGGGHED